VVEFYIVGLHRSGTNYLYQLLKKNLNLKLINNQNNFSGTWKHSSEVFKNYKENTPFIILYKPIYQWVESIVIRKPDYGVNLLNQKLDKSNFITVENDIVINWEEKSYTLSDLVNCYKQTYENWIINLPKDIKERCFIVNYNDILTDSKIDVINNISKLFNIESPSKFKEIEWGFVSQSKQDNRKTEKYKKDILDYYLNNKTTLSDDYLKIIDKIIDKDFKNKIKNLTNSSNGNR
jgi:hypothetical protein